MQTSKLFQIDRIIVTGDVTNIEKLELLSDPFLSTPILKEVDFVKDSVMIVRGRPTGKKLTEFEDILPSHMPCKLSISLRSTM